MHSHHAALHHPQFEWAWQNPQASRHLHSPSALSPTTHKPLPQFPRSPLSNRLLTKVQVVQYMLTSAPWSRFTLKVMLFGEAVESAWKDARAGRGVVRTATKKKHTSKGKEREQQSKAELDDWEERDRFLDRVHVSVRMEGVDGMRLTRSVSRVGTDVVDDDSGAESDEPGAGKIVVNDGEPYPLFLDLSLPRRDSRRRPELTVNDCTHTNQMISTLLTTTSINPSSLPLRHSPLTTVPSVCSQSMYR